MAHVLLPCDLPNWADIQRNLAPLKTAKDSDQFVQGMTKVYEMCCISLEPEDLNQSKKESSDSRFEGLKKFIDEMAEEERLRFFSETLPNMVSQALCLRLAKPQNGFLYSLKREDESFELERSFVKSLLANAFFSTFPKRTSKTHPCLQNFSFCEFFHHLHHRSQQKKLAAFLRYFQKTEDRRRSMIRVQRKVLSSKVQPSLPSWLCSDRALVPLIVRQEGSIHNAEANVWRAFSCSSLVGGDVLQAAKAPESSLFFAFPELMCCLSFVEELEHNEAIIAHNVVPHGIHKNRQGIPQEVNICLMDSLALVSAHDKQFEDKSLLRELNKALTTFGSSRSSMDRRPEGEEDDRLRQRRQTPVGESSSSEHPSTASSRRASAQQDDEESSRSTTKQPLPIEKAKDSKKSTYLPVIPKASSLSENFGFRPVKESTNHGNSYSIDFPKLPTQTSGQRPLGSLPNSTSSSRSSTRSLKTASESSMELPLIGRAGAPPRTGDDEYYTADEDSDQCARRIGKRKQCSSENFRSKDADLSTLVLSTSSLVGEKPPPKQECKDGTLRQGSSLSSIPWESKDSSKAVSSQRSDSAGFVLGGAGSEEDIDGFARLEDDDETAERGAPVHERLEDFRKRIRRRTRRHLSRKMRSSSRSSYSFGSSSSSDMEDISEEEDMDDSFQYYPQVIRASNSEPSLASAKDDVIDIPPLSMGSDTVVMMMSGRKVVITSSSGQLKAYSYDGVSPNLPVPFKAKFRTRRPKHPSEEDASNADRPEPWSIRQIGIGAEKSITDSEEEQIRPASTSRLSSLSSFACPSQSSCNNDDEIVCRNKGDGPKCPMAVGPSRHGDPQLRALILWLAASMAGLPSLIFYTGHDFQLYELSTVYRKVLARHWTVGDLSCEVLRFCRNRLSPRRNSCSSSLFEQLLCSGATTLSSTPLSYSQHSLD